MNTAPTRLYHSKPTKRPAVSAQLKLRRAANLAHSSFHSSFLLLVPHSLDLLVRPASLSNTSTFQADRIIYTLTILHTTTPTTASLVRHSHRIRRASIPTKGITGLAHLLTRRFIRDALQPTSFVHPHHLDQSTAQSINLSLPSIRPSRTNQSILDIVCSAASHPSMQLILRHP